jgi:hypothetical protein
MTLPGDAMISADLPVAGSAQKSKFLSSKRLTMLACSLERLSVRRTLDLKDFPKIAKSQNFSAFN